MAESNWKKAGKILLWLILSAITLYILYLLTDLLIVLIISILLAFIFDPFVKHLEKEGLNRLTSTIIIFIVVGLFVYITLSVFVPKLLFQVNQLVQTLNISSLETQVTILEKEIYKYFPFFSLGEISSGIRSFIDSWIQNPIDRISILLSSIVSIIAILVIVPFITFFLLKDSKKIFVGILNILPNKYFEMSYWILKKVSVQLGRFVRAWIFDATFVGFTCGIGFYFIGIPNALPLGIIAGLGHLVPYFGPIIGGIPAIIISIIQYGDLSHVPYIFLLMLIVYALDNGLVQPYVFSKSVDMHPVVIILLIIAGSQLFGVLGMLLAIPTATVLKTAAAEIYFAFRNYKISRI
ncbi:MAG: AI-2E family transporter [Ignavibacteriaceae bacterium]